MSFALAVLVPGCHSFGGVYSRLLDRRRRPAPWCEDEQDGGG